MKRAALLAGLLVVLLACLAAPAWASPLTVEITPDPTRVATVLGGSFTITTQVANTGSAPTVMSWRISTSRVCRTTCTSIPRTGPRTGARI